MESPMRLLAALFVLPFAACGSIMGQPYGMVPIDSDPPGAVVQYQGADVGVTPCTIRVHRSNCIVVLAKDGFHAQQVDVGTVGNGWVAGNLIFGGLLGILIDAASGSTVVVNDDPVSVPLVPSAATAPAAAWRRPKPAPVPSGPDF